MDPASMEGRTLVWYSVFAGVTLLLLFLLSIEKKKRSRLPPGPPGWPIVGNLFQIGKNPTESLFHLAKKYGPLMTLQLGMRTTVVVSSPAMAREVLKNNDQIFAGRTVVQAAKSLSYNMSSLPWGDYGPRVRMLRRICNTELFSIKRLNALNHLRKDQVSQTIRLIHEEGCLKGKTVDIGHAAFVTSLNLLGHLIFSRDIFGRDSECAEELKETIAKLMVLGATPNSADFFPFLQFLDPQGICRDTTKCLTKLHAWFDKFIEDRPSNTQDNSSVAAEKDFLGVLLDNRTDGDGDGETGKFTRADIIIFILDFFIAGTETTATTIEWAMAELFHSPDIMKRVQAEVDEVVGRDRKVEESDIQNLPYLQVVVKEVLRLHPAVPLLLPHRAEDSCEIAGFVIPKHSQVIVNVWGIGRDPSIWNDATEFVPERFVGSEIDFKGNNLELMPFGAGRRICPGLPLANRMVPFVIASLLQSFDWSLPDGQIPQKLDMTENFGISLQKALPLMAIPTPRLPATLY